MSSPQGSEIHLNIDGYSVTERRKWIATFCMLILALVLILASIIRNEIKHVYMTEEQSHMLTKICQATVEGC